MRGGGDDEAIPAAGTQRRVALIGCGRRFISANGPALKALGASPVLVVDPARYARERVARMGFAGKSAIMTDELDARTLEQLSPDAVIISSPSGLHFAHGLVALAAGIPTFIEKPLACTADHARRLRLLGGNRITGSEQRVYRADLRLVRTLIRDGRLGEIRHLHYLDLVAPVPALASSWRNDPELAGGGILLDLGFHTLGALQWLLGRASVDFSVTWARIRHFTLRVEERVEARCSIGETEASIDIGFDAREPREVLTLRGSQGDARIQRLRRPGTSSAMTIRLTGRGSATTEIRLDGADDTRSLHDFMAGVSDGEHLVRQVDTLELLERIYATGMGRSSWLCG